MSTDLTVIDPAAVDAAADPAQYVVQACERAKTWLADALEHGDIEQIVELKSQVEAIRIYTMQKQLGKDAELSAAEIVRRAERGIGLAIRRGQEVGEIAKSGDIGATPGKGMKGGAQGGSRRGEHLVRPAKFASRHELSDAIYPLADTPEEAFESALDEAKSEANLSRKNVVRKVRAKRDAAEAKESAMSEPDVSWVPAGSDRDPKAAARRRELIRSLGSEGWTSPQIGEHLAITPGSIRRIAREEDIPIPADIALGRGTRKTIDSNRIVRETVTGLEGLDVALNLVRFDELDLAEVPNWTTSLTASIRVLNRLNKQLKEMIQ
jgi:hypothetical protein